MKIADFFNRIFRPSESILRRNVFFSYGDPMASRFAFGDVIFLNIVELLTDLAEEVEWRHLNDKDTMRFAEFVRLYSVAGKQMLTRLYFDGYLVVGYKDGKGFWLMTTQEYRCLSKTDATVVEPVDREVQVYVLKSSTWEIAQRSDKAVLRPFIEYLDNVLNASNTVSARLGSLIVCSPANLSNAPTQVVFNKEQKQELEEELAKEYGALSDQRQIMVLPRQMSFQTINLAGLDQRTADKARLAILAIADRIKVPANQIAFIDANSSKSLANGTELREGDFNKYQSFERLLNATFCRMAEAMGLQVDYNLYNKPQRVQAAQI